VYDRVLEPLERERIKAKANLHDKYTIGEQLLQNKRIFDLLPRRVTLEQLCVEFACEKSQASFFSRVFKHGKANEIIKRGIHEKLGVRQIEFLLKQKDITVDVPENKMLSTSGNVKKDAVKQTAEKPEKSKEEVSEEREVKRLEEILSEFSGYPCSIQHGKKGFNKVTFNLCNNDPLDLIESIKKINVEKLKEMAG